METAPPADRIESRPSRAELALALLWGVSLTLCVTGYTFGQSNHHVYLLDALYARHPENLARDWFTTHTLQYHVLYTWLVVGLEQIGLLKPGFFLLYLVLAAVMHAAWWSIVRQIGGGVRAYMVGTLLYHLNAGGLGLGVYQFLQDGSFLPSNIASVAALSALALHLQRRLLLVGVCVGIAGLFHLNYSLILIGFWLFASCVAWWRGETARPARYLLATALALAPCLFNVAIAAQHALSQTAKIPIEDFVPLYVKLRHPHHYDATGWPAALWISFLWPIPFAIYAVRKLAPGTVRRRLVMIFVLTLVLQAFAVTFAGIWFISETIVQMSLFRFSVFPKLISCVLTGWLIERSLGRFGRVAALLIATAGLALLMLLAVRSRLPATVPPPSVGLLVGAGVLALTLAMGLSSRRAGSVLRWVPLIALPATLYFAATQRLGVAMPGESDASMVDLADWVRQNTATDALFLTPPADSAFRLQAQRSAVVGFKHVPQLSGELVEWKRRLDRVLDRDILTLPTPMPRTLAVMDERYAQLSTTHFAEVASEFECDYLVALRRLEEWDDRLVYRTANGHYWLYRLHEPAGPS